MDSWAVLVALFVILIGILVRFLRKGEIAGLPEPPGNIIFGHVLHLGGNFCRQFLEWKAVVGPVFQLRIFHVRVVIFNDRESIAKVFGLPEASGRPRYGVFQKASEIIGEGLVISEGKMWEEQRQFYMKAFRTFGIGRTETEKSLQYEIRERLEEWENLKGAPFTLNGCSTTFVFNALWNVLATTRLEAHAVKELQHQNQKSAKMDTLGHKLASMSVTLAEMFTNAVQEKIEGMEALMNLAFETAVQHQKDHISKKPRDVIDQILDRAEVTTDESSAFHKNNTKTGFGVGEIVSATIDTTSRTLEWCMLYLARNSKVAEKLHAEIDTVLSGEAPSLAHRDRMPYTQACILETQRMGSVVPMGVPHKALEDFEFNGAVISKGTILIMNLYGVHYDTEVWDQPEEFRPERFLTPGGDQIDQSAKNKIVPFGLGRRMCPGNAIAMDSMFLFVANAYQNFKFEMVGGNTGDVKEDQFGLIRQPPEGVLMKASLRC